MIARFAFHERREGSFFYHFLLGTVSVSIACISAIISVGIISIVVIGILRILGIDYAPARF